MGFKLPGKSIQSGTSAHSSALKMVAEQRAASALKAKASPAKETDWAAMHAKANKKYNRYKNLTTEEYKAEAQRQMAHYKKTGKWDAGGVYDHKGNKIKKDEPKQEIKEETTITKVEPTKEQKIETKAEDKKTNIQTKADKKIAEVDENLDKKKTKMSVKDARKKYGRGSKEHLEAKKQHLQAKETDRQGGKGGKKQGLFRKLSSKINVKRQKNIDKKLETKEEDSPTKDMKTGKYKQKFEK